MPSTDEPPFAAPSTLEAAAPLREFPNLALRAATAEEALRPFVLWTLHQQNLIAEEVEPEVFRVALPENRRAAFDGAEELWFTFDKACYDSARRDDLELAAPGSRLVNGLVEQVRRLGLAAHAAPAGQPQSVREIAASLYAAYRVEGGQLHLAGCALEDRPILQVTERLRLEGLEPRDELLTVHVAADGTALDAEQTAALGACNLIELPKPPPTTRSTLPSMIDRAAALIAERRAERERALAAELRAVQDAEEAQLRRYFAGSQVELQVARDAAEDDAQREALDEQAASLQEQLASRLAMLQERFTVRSESQLVAAIVIWCKHASGKLRFTIGSATADVPFAAWTARLQPPPFPRQASASGSFHVAATDDGRLAAAEDIVACSQSGERVLAADLWTCAATGVGALPRHFEECPVSGARVLRTALAPCPHCGVAVAPQTLAPGGCEACRRLERITKSDPRLARVLGEYPKLDGWRNWQLAESRRDYVLVASGFLRRLLLVFDKQSLEARRLATSGRFFAAAWEDVAPSGQHEFLG